jgi:Tfp pilus assembly PilM family ATPase
VLSSGRLHYREPIFSAGGHHVSEEKKFLVAEVRKFIDFYKAAEGDQNIDIVYLTGEPKVSEGVQETLRSNLGLAVQQFDFARGVKIEISGFSQPQSEERARRLAPEIGFAWQQLEAFNSKNPSGELTVEQWDDLA